MASLLSSASQPTASQTATVKLLGTHFVTERNLFSLETPTGWASMDRPLTMRDFMDHLSGDRTLAVYPGAHGQFFCINVDLTSSGWTLPLMSPDELADRPHVTSKMTELNMGIIKCDPAMIYMARSEGWRFLSLMLLLTADVFFQVMATALPDVHPVGLMTGGRGLHVYGFTAEPQPRQALRDMARDLLADPKLAMGQVTHDSWAPLGPNGDQNRIISIHPTENRPLRLPLGRHAVTGRRSYFFDPHAPRDPTQPWEPVTLLPTVALPTRNS